MGLLNKKLNFIIFQVSVTKQVSSFGTFNLIVEIGSSLGIVLASKYFFSIRFNTTFIENKIKHLKTALNFEAFTNTINRSMAWFIYPWTFTIGNGMEED